MLIGGHQPVALQRGGDDHAVGRFAGQVAQEAGPGGDLAVHRDLDEAVAQQSLAPGRDIAQERQPALVVQHRDLPEADGGDGDVAVLHGAFDDIARPSAEIPVPEALPEQDVGIEQDHGLSTRSGLD